MCKKLIGPALLALLAVSAQAGRYLSGDVDGDAQWVAHADVDRLRGTQFGQYLMGRMEEPKAEDKFAAFQAMFRFDPRKDLNGLTAYGWGKEKVDGVLIVRGQFDAAHLETLLKANDDYSAGSHADHVIHSWVDDKDREKAEADGVPATRKYGSFQAPGVAVMADRLEYVTRALDVLDGRAASAAAAQPFAGIETVSDSAFLMAAANTGQMKTIEPKSSILNSTQRLLLGLGEVAGELNGFLRLSAPSPEAAAGVKMIADGILGLMLLNAENDPAGARLATGTQVNVEGNDIAIRMGYPVADVIEHIEKEEAKKQAAP